jgi:hypothetical protein
LQLQLLQIFLHFDLRCVNSVLEQFNAAPQKENARQKRRSRQMRIGVSEPEICRGTGSTKDPEQHGQHTLDMEPFLILLDDFRDLITVL